jgi:hypothetical protein
MTLTTNPERMKPMTPSTLEPNNLNAQHTHVNAGWNSVPVTTFDEMRIAVAHEDLTKTDHRIARQALRLDPELRLDGVPLTDHALRQFAAASKTPSGVLALRDIGQTARLSEILNEQMAKVGASQDPCVVRLRKDPQDEAVVRAVFGRVPIFFDAVNALELLADIIGEHVDGAILPRVQTNGDTYAIKMFLPDSILAGRDTRYGRGLAVTIDEVGGGTSLAAFTFDHACLNGMIAIREQLRLKLTLYQGVVDYVETGKGLQRSMDVLTAAGDDLLTQMGYAYDIAVEEPEKVIAYLTKEHRLTEEEGKHWFTGYIDETAGQLRRPKRTAYSIVNGLNKGAHSINDPCRRDELEGLTARVLAPSRGSGQEDMRAYWDNLGKKASKLAEADYLKYQWLSCA